MLELDNPVSWSVGVGNATRAQGEVTIFVGPFPKCHEHAGGYDCVQVDLSPWRVSDDPDPTEDT